MKKFLNTVVDHYFGQLAESSELTPQSANQLAMTQYLFVFPSRRSSLFFNQYLYERFKKVVFAPKSTTIADLFALFSDVKVASHTQQLLRLYKVYNQVVAETVERSRQEGNPITFRTDNFDSFIFWGDMLLHDFDDVDKYLADAKQVFCNVRDLKQLEQDLGGLDEEIVKIIKSFWSNVNLDTAKVGDAKQAFGYTWSIIYEIYTRFRTAMLAEGLAYEGMRERLVVEQIQQGNLTQRLEDLPPHIVFVGITAINETERALFKWLQQEKGAEFCWDYADPHLKPQDDEPLNRHNAENPANAAYFSKSNLKDFKNALSDDELDSNIVPETERNLVRMAVPSGVGQAVEAAKILRNWKQQYADDMNTAVILPDEHLLVPMLYAMPQEYGQYNVTMGYSLKQTQAAAFVDALAQLQNNVRYNYNQAAAPSFYYQNVLQVLGHSYMINLLPEVVDALNHEIRTAGLYQVPISRFAQHPLMQAIFKPVNTIPETSLYLNHIFDLLLECYEEDNETALERESLLAYKQLVDDLNLDLDTLLADTTRTVDRAGGESLNRNTFFRLLQRLAQGKTVAFSGEPLSGLQIMGILETRSLDFERIILLSMNEGVFPSKPSSNSFIPNTLRSAFGLPTQRHKDSVIAYHFYRLLSRAKEVYLLYDSRQSGMQSGEQSRYLLQLQYLGKGKMQTVSSNQQVSTEDVLPLQVPKTASVMQALSVFLKPNQGRCLSASSLKTYITCPMQFYLAHVLHMQDADDLDEEMADSQFGNILHLTMQNLYQPALGKRLQADFFETLLDAKNQAVRQAINASLQQLMPNNEPTGYMELVLRMVEEYVLSILRHDKKLTPFVYLASEANQIIQYQVNSQLTVNLMSVYDRLDIVTRNANPSQLHLRVVDYKTGNANKGGKLTLSSIADLFNSEGKASKEAFQVMFYCLMLRYANPDTLQKLNLAPTTALNAYSTIEPHLYFSRMFVGANDPVNTILTYKPGKNGPASGEENFTEQDITNFEQFAGKMEEHLKQLLAEIFNPQIPFSQCSTDRACQYCKFKAICGRV